MAVVQNNCTTKTTAYGPLPKRHHCLQPNRIHVSLACSHSSKVLVDQDLMRSFFRPLFLSHFLYVSFYREFWKYPSLDLLYLPYCNPIFTLRKLISADCIFFCLLDTISEFPSYIITHVFYKILISYPLYTFFPTSSYSAAHFVLKYYIITHQFIASFIAVRSLLISNIFNFV